MVSKVIMNDKKVNIVTQQYDTGLYVCIYSKDYKIVLEQFTLDVTEAKFHDDLINNYKTWR